MKLKINTEIALTHITSRMKQSIVAALGVTFGISMYIFVNSILSGTNDYFEKTTLSNIPHVRIYNDLNSDSVSVSQEYFGDQVVSAVSSQKPLSTTNNIRNPWYILNLVKRDPEVTAATAQVTSNVFYNNGSVQINGSAFGVNILEEDKMFDLKSMMQAGRIEDLLKINNGILIGSGIASKLNIKLNDNLYVASAQGVTKLMKVVGIFQTSISNVDNTKSYASISNVQQLLMEDGSYITDIKFNLKDKDLAPEYVNKYIHLTGYSAEAWSSANQTVGAGMVIRNFIAQAMLITILVVAGFGIYNILNMTIHEKMKDIAILKANGFAGNDITNIFITEATLIGLSGGVAGVILGYVISYLAAQIPIKLAGLNTLPIDFTPSNYILGFLFGTVTTLLAGYLPAKKAATVDPVQIIRG